MRPNSAKADQASKLGYGQRLPARQPEHRPALRPEGLAPPLVHPEQSHSWRTWRSSVARAFGVSLLFVMWSSKLAETQG